MASPASARSRATRTALQRQCALRTVVFKNVEVAADSSNAVVKTDSMVNTAFWLYS